MTAAPRGVARATARERLLAHCDAQTPKIMPRVWRARTRRLLAAVLREAAEAAVEAARCYPCNPHDDDVREAVLRAGRSRMGGAR
jgi:hypothetical protein